MIDLVCSFYDLTVSMSQQVVQVIQWRWIFIFKSVQKSFLNSAVLQSLVFENLPESFKLLPHIEMEINSLFDFLDRKFVRKSCFVSMLV